MTILASLNQSFTGITSDSRAVVQGGLFLAYPGEHNDGRTYIESAIAAGAACILWESANTKEKPFYWKDAWKVNNHAIENLKKKVGEIAAEFYQYPSKKCAVIGVTGTNGKTSVSQWIAQCLTMLGEKTAVIGTIGNGFIEAQKPATNTTPDAILLQKMLADYVSEGAKNIAMEVSSHGLSQGRVNGVIFDVAVLTNLTRDHLDYHKTMETYAAAKRQLFDWQNLRVAILNADDAFGASIIQAIEASKKNYLSYGIHSEKAHIRGSELSLNTHGLSMKVHTPKGSGMLKANVLGEFNAYNLLAVLATLLSLDIDLNAALSAISHIQPVAGRMQQLGGKSQPLVVIDYAHTPDALEKVLTTLRQQMTAEQRLICVFGCGGDRDAGKRPLMGQVAAQCADVTVVTSDNPRNEAPEVIIQDVIKTFTSSIEIEIDRAKAIFKAISLANTGDIVLIAGKGHEDYQEISGVKYPFSDVVIAKNALAKMHQTQVAI